MIDDTIVSENPIINSGTSPAGTQNPEESGKKRNKLYFFQDRGWLERFEHLYVTVIDSSEEPPEYHFAYNDHGKIGYIVGLTVKEPLMDDDEVLESGLIYSPRHLLINVDGQPVTMVGLVEKKAIENLKRFYTSEEIKTEIRNHIVKYCDMSELDIDLCTYYIFMTWFYPKLSTVPYLRLRADTGKGKSRILRTVADLSFLPLFAAGNSSASGTIRNHEAWHGTLVIDEADLKGVADNDSGYANDMIKFLNLGFERGQYFVKSDKVNPKNTDVFDPFSPKIIAMRGVFQDPATEGRCLSISPNETERTDIPAILPSEYYIAVKKLRAMLLQYTVLNWGILTEDDEYPSFNDVNCEPRLKQLGSPLARVLSKVFPDGMAEFKHYIERRQTEIKIDRAHSFHGGVVNAAYDAAIDPDNARDVVTVSEVAAAMVISSQNASRTLKNCGMMIESRKVRIRQGLPDQPIYRSVTQKVVCVKDGRAWREVCSRYIIVTADGQGTFADNDITCPAALRYSKWIDN